MNEREDQRGDPEEHWNRQQQASEGVTGHGESSMPSRFRDFVTGPIMARFQFASRGGHLRQTGRSRRRGHRQQRSAAARSAQPRRPSDRQDSKFEVKIPLHPFLGCIGVAPAGGEARSSIVPAEFGGNMDAPEATLGNTVYFPVNVKGGLLYMGDGHAAMGDGEVAGAAIEVPLRVRVQVSVIKGHKINWPRFENDEAIMTVGAYRPVDDALRIAFTELVGWIHEEYGLSQLDAYELLGKVAKIRLAEMVDPNYVVIASIEKKYLPVRKK